MNIHETIITALTQKLGKERDWRTELAKTLTLSKSTLYKRLTGVTAFTPEEIATLVQVHGISFDAIALGIYNNRVSFKVPPTHQSIKNFDEYLKGLENTFRSVEEFNDVTVYIVTRDLPLFYHFRDSDLGLFKLYAYGRFMWELDSCLNYPFSLAQMELIPNIRERINRIWDKYAELNTVEFWQPSALDVTFQQIQYFWESGVMTVADALRVLDSLSKIVATTQKTCGQGIKTFSDKTNAGKLEMYCNRITNIENMILATTDERDALHVIIDPSRFIVTFDEMMTRTAANSIQQVKKSSYFMGEGTGNVRDEFFLNLERRIDQMRKKIELADKLMEI